MRDTSVKDQMKAEREAELRAMQDEFRDEIATNLGEDLRIENREDLDTELQSLLPEGS